MSDWKEWLLGNAVSGAASGLTEAAVGAAMRAFSGGRRLTPWAERILGKGYEESFTRYCGLMNEAPSKRAELVDGIADNVYQRVNWEILKVLPETLSTTFVDHVNAGRVERALNVMRPFTGDPDRFIQHHVKQELDILCG